MSDAENWQRLGILAGFEESEVKQPQPAENPENSSEVPLNSKQNPTPLLDEEDIEEEGEINRFSFTSSKLPIVLLTGLMVLGGLGIGAYTTFGAKKTVSAKSETAPVAEIKTSQADPEKGELQAKLGFREQNQQLNQINTPKPTQTPYPRQSQTTLPTQKRSSHVPSSRPVRNYSAPNSSPTLVRRPSVPSPPTRTYYSKTVSPTYAPPPTVPILEQPEKNPQKVWQEAASIGSYGGTQAKAEISNPAQTETKVGEIGKEAEEVKTGYEQEEMSILTGKPINITSIPVGANVGGVLETAVYWDSGNKTREEDIYVVRLLAPLEDREGKILIPINSLIFVSAVVSNSGLIKLQPRNLITIQSDGTEKDIPLPERAFSIRRGDGSPLIAKREEYNPNRQGIDGVRLGLDIVKTAAQFGLQGNGDGYRDLYQMNQLEQFYDRNFQQNDNQFRTPSQPVYSWQLKEGTQVEIYVTQSIRLEI